MDAPVTLAWCFPDEASEYADRVLVALKGQAIVVPAVWGLEIANAMLAGERRKRLKQPEILRFVALLEDFQLFRMVRGRARASAMFCRWRAIMVYRHTMPRIWNSRSATAFRSPPSTRNCGKQRNGRA